MLRIYAWLTWFGMVFSGNCLSEDDWMLQYIPQTLKIDDETQIFIFDDVMSNEQLRSLNAYATFPLGNHRFMLRNLEAGLQNGVTPFYTILNKTEFTEFQIFAKAKSFLENVIGRNVRLEEVHTEYLHSLDPKPPVKDSCEHNVYHVGLFLNSFWLHNSYGQISFYSWTNNSLISDKGRLEIVHTVHPKPARMIIWPSCAVFSAHPPSVNIFNNLLMVKMGFAVNEEGKEGAESFEKEKQDQNVPSRNFGDLKFTNADADRKIDYKKHLKRTFYDSKKRGIYVFDDLFTLEESRLFLQHLLDTGTPHLTQYDGTPSEDHDNVQWISGYEIEEFLKTPVWPRMQDLLVFITNEDKWYPYDVAMNYVRPADHTRIHPDAEKHQREYTFVLYLSENISQSDLGEIVFVERKERDLDGIHQFTNPGGEEYETVAAVWPKYGRLVVFRNVIEHSARPLSTSQLGCRYSFAVKVSRNERLSLIKQLYETMEAAEGDVEEEYSDFSMELSAGNHDDPQYSPLTLETLKEKLVEAETQKKNDLNGRLGKLKEILK